MKRIAIIGGGISGLAAAYELELARKRGADIDWHLYEASNRLGGIIETTRFTTDQGEWILEGGPDAWVSEKPWARDLAIELGLEDELIYSNDTDKKTYIYVDGKLQALPDRMRMMVPTDLAALDNSPLFSESARQAYRNELTRAEELRASAPEQDESVASFVRRHFGDEVLEKVAAPLLSGVFGGDVHKLSVRAVMPAFVKMEQEHGSLVLVLQRQAEVRGNKPSQPTFTSLKNGMASLVEAIVQTLPSERIHRTSYAYPQKFGDLSWLVGTGEPVRLSRTGDNSHITFAHVILATPLDWARRVLHDPSTQTLLPTEASSAVLVAFAWSAEEASTFSISEGFGFLVPPVDNVQSQATDEPELLACTFVDQKFANRVPAGGRVIRAFFGSDSAERFAGKHSRDIAQVALSQLAKILGPLPQPTHSETTRWPRSLPQYEVGHLDRMAQLDELVSRIPGLHLLGNSYRGVGLPDLIRDARATAKRILE